MDELDERVNSSGFLFLAVPRHSLSASSTSLSGRSNSDGDICVTTTRSNVIRRHSMHAQRSGSNWMHGSSGSHRSGDLTHSSPPTTGGSPRDASKKVPRLVARSRKLTRVYLANLKWSPVAVKLIVNIYMCIIAYMLFVTCEPWYTYFKYLTAWGWTLVQVYFLYTFYLDLCALWYGSQDALSQVATTVAQALSEVAFAVQVAIVLLFWFVIFPVEPWRDIRWEFNMHGCGLVLMILDYVYRFVGFSLRYNRWVIGFAVLYTAVHLSVVFFTGEPIYPGMHFRDTFSIVIYLVAVSTVVWTHKVFYLLHHWPRVRQDLKTVIGITIFLLWPGSEQLEIFVPGTSLETWTEMTSTVLTRPPGGTPPSISRSTSKEFEVPGLRKRLANFVGRELLSLSPTATVADKAIIMWQQDQQVENAQSLHQ